MWFRYGLMSAVVVAMTAAVLPASPAAAAPGGNPTIERLIVAYAPQVKAWTSVDDVAAEEFTDADLQAGKWIGFGYRTVELPEAVTEAEAERIAADLSASPEVLVAEPDVPVSIAIEPETLTINPQAVQANPPWGLDRIDQRLMPLNGVYGYDNTGSGVRAYIVDTGIRSTHVEFASRVSDDSHTEIFDDLGPEDCHGHGTHVAGTVGGSTYGVAKDVTLVSVRVLGCSGFGSTQGVINGMDWIANNHPANTPGVVNMSLGRSFSQAMNDAVNTLVNSGLTVVVASGNSGDDPDWWDACLSSPASARAAITVNASNESDVPAWFSNSGACTDLYAPGQNVLSSTARSNVSIGYSSGTSMAAPHVAGAVARILQADPALTPAQVWQSMSTTATQLSSLPRNAQDTDKLLFTGTPSPSAPSAPTGANAVAGNEQVSISWTAPAYDGTQPVTSYTATAVNRDDSCTVTGAPPVTSCVITGLTNWQNYAFTVTATNSIGTSSASTATASVLPGRVAEAPTISTVTAGAGLIEVSWTPGNDFSAPSTQYIARASPGTRACASTGTTCTITGLTGGVDYTVTVVARNSFGDSSASAPSATVTPTAGIITVPDPGTVVGWGQAASLPAGFETDIIDISAGGSHLLAVTGAGEVLATGANDDGQATVPGSAQFNATNVAAGDRHSLALVGGGVVAWGDSSRGQTTVPLELQSGVSAIAAGRDHSLALKAGQIFAWGSNTYGQTSIPDDSLGYSAIAAGIYHSLALRDGKVVTWGGESSLLAIPDDVADDTIVAIAAGHTLSMALSDTGRVYAWGDGARGIPTVPPALNEGVTDIAMGDQVAFAIKNGEVYAWGWGEFGLTTVPSSAGAGIELVTGGYDVAAAIRSTPVAPTGVTATRVDDTTVDITWDAVTRTGTPLLGYEVSYSVSDSSGALESFASSTPDTSFIIDGISPGQQVQFNVAARNSLGTGSATTVLWPIAPAPVTNLQATAGDAKVSLSWGAPVDDGGAPVTGYAYRIGSDGWISLLPDQTSVVIEGLSNGTAVTIHVRAMNSIGGGSTTSITRTPQAPIPPPPPVAPPPPPPPPPAPAPEPEPEPEPAPVPIAPEPAPITEPVAPGSGYAIEGGQPVDLRVGPIESGRGLNIAGPDFDVFMESFGPDGEPILLDEDGALVLEPYLGFVTQGTGYLPGSEVAQYLVSVEEADIRQAPDHLAPTEDIVGSVELGRGFADADGLFVEFVVTPAETLSGDYVVQIVGTSPQGTQRVVNVGVRVQEPEPVILPSLLITGSRAGKFVRVVGESTGIVGQTVFPMYKFPGMTSYVPGRARRVIAEDGTFTWQRRTNKKFYVYFTGDLIRSTMVRIPAR